MKYFTIDLEEWWGVESFKPYFTKNPLPEDDRIMSGLDTFLELLEKHNQTATFFVLGRVAQKYPDIVPMLIDKGHSIGTHGYNHELVYNQNPNEFEKDLNKSIEVLSLQSGEEIKAYRAPSYSITSKSLWAIELLRKNGITIDSSISPASNSRFGIAGASEKPYQIQTKYGNLLELPPNVLNLLVTKLPVTSGIGFRLFPKWVVNRAVKSFDRRGIDTMFIFHNWEADRFQPVIKAGLKPNCIHYHGIKDIRIKVEALLQRYEFLPLSEMTTNLTSYRIIDGKLKRTL